MPGDRLLTSCISFLPAPLDPPPSVEFVWARRGVKTAPATTTAAPTKVTGAQQRPPQLLQPQQLPQPQTAPQAVNNGGPSEPLSLLPQPAAMVEPPAAATELTITSSSTATAPLEASAATRGPGEEAVQITVDAALRASGEAFRRDTAAGVSAARARWDADMALIDCGITHFLCNRWRVAEELCLHGANAAPVAMGPDGDPPRDLRGAFALLHANIALVRGVAEMTDGQLEEAVPRLQRADALLAATESWVGQRMVRGLCTLTLGLCMVAQSKYVQGAWKLLGAFRTITRLSEREMLEYKGKEAAAIRSTAMYTLGALYVAMLLVPPAVARFTGHGPGLERGLDLLRACFR